MTSTTVSVTKNISFLAEEKGKCAERKFPLERLNIICESQVSSEVLVTNISLVKEGKGRATIVKLWPESQGTKTFNYLTKLLCFSQSAVSRGEYLVLLLQ